MRSTEIGSPQSNNLYVYTENDPINRVDLKGLDNDPIDQAVNKSSQLITGSLCKSLFGGNDPLEVLKKYADRIAPHTWVSYVDSEGRTRVKKSFDNTLRPERGVGGQYSKKDDMIYFNTNSTFYNLQLPGRIGTVPYQAYGPFSTLSAAELRAVYLIHELIHTVDGFPEHNIFTDQSQIDTIKVVVYCILLNPNRNPKPVETQPGEISTQFIESRPVSIVGGSRYPAWYYSTWEFVNWVNSIPVGEPKFDVTVEWQPLTN